MMNTVRCKPLAVGGCSLALAFLVTLASQVIAQEPAWTYSYNDRGQITEQRGPRTDVEDITRHTYDAQGNHLTTTNALGHIVSYNAHDASGRPLSFTDANSIITTLSYHSRGWVTESRVRHPSDDASLDHVTSYEYDAVGQLTRLTLAHGASMVFEYDAARRLTALENDLGERMEYTLDAAGNRTQEVIRAGNGQIHYSVTRAFDELSRVMDVLGNNGQHEHLAYDVNDNNTAVTDGRTHTTETAYDALNRVASVIDPMLGKTLYTYNEQNQITSVTDPKGLITHYNYDGLGNLIELISPDTGTTTLAYDLAGNRIRTTDARGQVTEYQYDALNRLIQISYVGAPEQNIHYHYDDTTNGNFGLGRLTSFSDASGLTEYRYNHLGAITEKRVTINGVNFTLQYHYDAAGQLTGIRYPSGRDVHIERDSQGLVEAMATRPNPQAPLQVLMENSTYLPFGPLSEFSFGNGLVDARQYNQDYRLTGIALGSTDPLMTRLYQYDAANNITQIDPAKTSGQSKNYSYDPLNRLTHALSLDNLFSYEYDPVGNRAQKSHNAIVKTYEYGTVSHRLLQRDNTVYQYDAVGNTLDNGQYQFSYSANNRLVQVLDAGTVIARYKYNALGQRVVKQTGADPNQSQVTLYLYNESGQLIGEYDASGQVTREYIYLDTTPLALATEGQVYYYHNDHLATPKLLTDANRNVVWQARHTPFGKAELQVELVTNNLRFPGQYFDSETGLHYNYFRDYDPEVGRYLQSDPIGLRGGINTYAYVGGNPIMYFDPFGLARFCFRPLQGYENLYSAPNSLGGYYVRPAHEQLWFDDGTNVGFFSGGGVCPVDGEIRDDSDFSIDDYDCVGPEYDDDLMQQALESVRPRWEDSTYCFAGRNCQNFAADLRREYDRLSGRCRSTPRGRRCR
jgi:RHS repeat-associated protein